jgi:N-ethylmaleimide reductase
MPNEIKPLAPEVKKKFSGILVLNLRYNKETSETVLSQGLPDAVSFGPIFIGNPDLPERCGLDAPITPPDKNTFYGGGSKGYTD